MTISPDLDRLLAAGNEALAEARWQEARATFQAAANVRRSAEAEEGVSWAAWWLGDQSATMAARERASSAYLAAEDARGAARMAAWLASDHLDFAGDEATASKWLQRAAARVGETQACPERALIALLEADVMLAKGEPQPAAERADQMVTYVRALSDRSLEVVGMAILGSARVSTGFVDAGLAQLDEAAAMAVRQQRADPVAAGWALSRIATTGVKLGDIGRAMQWCNALEDLAKNMKSVHLTGVGRTVRGGLLMLTGDWTSADRELSTALRELQTTRPALSNLPAARMGVLRARRGDREQAKHMLEASLPHAEALLELGELSLQARQARAAADAAERLLARLPEGGPLARMPALELLARARAAAGDERAARNAAAAVERMGDELNTPYKRARALLVKAEVRYATGERNIARRAVVDAIELFDRCGASYDAARARMLLSAVLKALGDEAGAQAEQQAGREALGGFGVTESAPAVDLRMLSARDKAVLRLLGQGMDDEQIAQRLFLSVGTVERQLELLIAKLQMPSREAAAKFAASTQIA